MDSDSKRAERRAFSEPALGAPGWRLVDSFEQEGVRYIVVCADAPESLLTLTERERQVVEHAALGCSNKEIARALGVSDATVRVLMSRAAARFGVRKRKELLAHPALRDLLVPARRAG